MMHKPVFLFFVLLIPVMIQGQEKQSKPGRPPYEIHTYTTRDGLSQVSVNDIVQDDEGFLWIGTQSGLNRFDGSFFHAFDNIDNGKGNCGNYINVLVPDYDRIWIGSRDRGLCYFEKKAHRFYNIEALQDFNIEDMAMDSLNRLYFTAENKGIGFLETTGAGKENFTVSFLPYFKDKNITVTAVFITASGTLWVGTMEGRLLYAKVKSDPRAMVFHEFPLLQKPDKVNVINARSDDEVWVGTQNKLLRVDVPSQTVHEVVLDNVSGNSSVIYDLKWNGEMLWVGTGAGLFEYDVNNNRPVAKFVHSEKRSNTISNDVVYSILMDDNDQLWVGTGKYLNLFYNNEVFKKIRNSDGVQGSLNSNIVFAILKYGQDLWVGTSGGGINLIRDGKSYFFTKKSHLLPSDICFALLGDQNNVWAGTREGLVIIRNCFAPYRSMKVQKIFHNPDDPASLSSNFIRYLYKDDGNNIWLCANGGGLNLFTGDLSESVITFKRFRHKPGIGNSIASDKVNYILQIDTGRYWVATDKGLSIMTFDRNNFDDVRFSRLTAGDSVVLDKAVIYTLLKDSEGGVWIGTTGGLYFWQNGRLKYYDTQDGLPDNVIYAVLEDVRGSIWMSTNKGLSRFDKKSGTFTNYHQADGLSSEEYDLHARFIDDDGNLYFGGIDGITRFDPQALGNTRSAGKLYIDNIQILNADENSVEVVYSENNQQLFLKQEQFPVIIHFSNINLKYDKSSTFAYRLLPDNTRWNKLKDKRSIQLMNLSPDNYTLEIQEVGKDKRLHNDNLLRIPITVVPYWWRSDTAYLFYIIFILLTIYAFFRFSLKRKIELQENIRLKELDNLKSRLYANITHEFRTPLTVIKGMADELREKLPAKDLNRCDEKLEMIERNSNKLLHLVKQMLDMSKIEDGKMKVSMIRGDIISYLQYVLESFQSMADAKNIKLVFYHETDKVVMDYDQDKIFIIASNLLSNAIKFTPDGGKIIFHVKKESIEQSGYLVIKVQDSGIGIGKEHLEHIFDRFYQVDNTSTRKGEGTGIGLALTKELVKLLNGEISVRSTPGKRTEFKIILPITGHAALEKSKPLRTKRPDPVNGTVELVIEEERENGLPLALVVEDNPDVAKYIISCLRGKYRVQWSPDGEKGIEAAVNSIPDIIISDVMMPVKDGFEVCETLKKDERTSHIPIVLLTAKATDDDRIEGLSYGADAYLTKPFNKKELFVRLEQLIKIRKQLQEKYCSVELNITEKDEPKGEEVFLKKVVLAIEQNIDNPGFDAVNLSGILDLSESQLYRKLKALNGKSVSIFIRDVRLFAAKRLIEGTSLNISQIAYQCGFNDPAWFSRTYKTKFGVSPSQNRKKNKA